MTIVIPTFWWGFTLGAVAATVALIALGIWSNRKQGGKKAEITEPDSIEVGGVQIAPRKSTWDSRTTTPAEDVRAARDQSLPTMR